MKTEFIIDAERFATKVYNSLNPFCEEAVIYASHEKDVPHDYSNKGLFTFKYEGILDYLQRMSAISSYIKNREFKFYSRQSVESKYYQLFKKDMYSDDFYIGYLTDNELYGNTIDKNRTEIVPYYTTQEFYDDPYDFGKSTNIGYYYPFEGFYSVGIKYAKLSKFIKQLAYYDKPILEIDELKYCNETIKFKGKQLKYIEFLLKNLNNFCKEEDLYNYVENINPKIESHNKIDINTAREFNKSFINQIKKKFEPTQEIKDHLQIKSNNGTGLFLTQ